MFELEVMWDRVSYFLDSGVWLTHRQLLFMLAVAFALGWYRQQRRELVR
jgi:hypothetical protein